MSDRKETFSTLLTCMDGRVQKRGYDYAKQLFGTDWVDVITEPGIDGLLTGTHSVVEDDAMLAFLQAWCKKKVGISVGPHGSRQILVVGHCGCAGNVADKDVHVQHVQDAMAVVSTWGYFDEVRGIIFNSDWEIEEVTTTLPQLQDLAA